MMVQPYSNLSSTLNEDSDRILVMIRLNGGNDGLNMVVPLDQYSNLSSARSNILLPEKSLLPVTDTVGFHPAIKGLWDLHQKEQLGIIQNVGYPNQNGSHFRSSDIWTSGSPYDKTWDTGWLGRYFTNRFPNYPEGFPNTNMPDPLAISMGNMVSMSCQGVESNYSAVIDDPFTLTELKQEANEQLDTSSYGKELTFLRNTIGLTSSYRETILTAAEKGNNLVTYPEGNSLAKQLKHVALLISGGLKTKFYIVSQGGYDTHGNQVVDGDPTQGEHAELLKDLSEAIASFQQDLSALGLQERVVGVTFSEFGRRIRSNDSLGTDHGAAAPMLVFGSCILPQILGDNPVIKKNTDPGDGVAMQFDFRDVYGSLLQSLFSVSTAEVKQILYKDFKYLPII